MTELTKRLNEILGKLQSPRAKMIFLEGLLKKAKKQEHIDEINRLLAQVIKEEENQKREAERAKKAASDFEKMLMEEEEDVRKRPAVKQEDETESIENQLLFTKTPETEIPTLEKESGYLGKDDSAYNPNTLAKEATKQAYKPESETTRQMEFREPGENEWEVEGYKKTDSYKEKDSPTYVPKGEIEKEGKEKEEYKRKKLL